MMNRRRFLGSLAAGSAALAVPTLSAAKPVEYARNMTGIRWVDWFQPPGQLVLIGYWAVMVRPDDTGRNVLVSTTLNSVQRRRECEQIAFLLARDWPLITIFSTDAEKEAVKQRALEALCDAMR